MLILIRIVEVVEPSIHPRFSPVATQIFFFFFLTEIQKCSLGYRLQNILRMDETIALLLACFHGFTFTILSELCIWKERRVQITKWGDNDYYRIHSSSCSPLFQLIIYSLLLFQRRSWVHRWKRMSLLMLIVSSCLNFHDMVLLLFAAKSATGGGLFFSFHFLMDPCRWRRSWRVGNASRRGISPVSRRPHRHQTWVKSASRSSRRLRRPEKSRGKYRSLLVSLLDLTWSNVSFFSLSLLFSFRNFSSPFLFFNCELQLGGFKIMQIGL